MTAMPVIGRSSQRRPALVAAASPIEPSTNTQPYKPEQESDELWGLYRALGEMRFIVNFKANAAARLTYYPGIIEEPGQDPDPEGVDAAASDAFDAVQGPLGEFGDFVAELAMHQEVVGEGFFIGQSGDDGDEFDVWSSDEYRRASQPGSASQHKDEVRPLTDDDIQVRIWRPDPQWRHRADSPFRSVRTEAETLILLRNMTQALMRSRLPAKILGIPDELSFVSNNPEEENAESDPFMNDLIDAVVTSVTDDKSAARFAPLLIRGPGDRLDQITSIDLTRDMPEWLNELTDQSIRRLAAGMDIPAEVILGIADVNHWTAWQIEESAYKQHVDPLVSMILDSLTRGYLWPYLREAGLAEDRVRRHRFWRDYSDLTARTASVESAVQVFDRGGISLESLRRTTGFNEYDAPEEEGDEAAAQIDSDELAARANAAGIFIRSGFTPEGALAAVGLPEIPHTGLLPVTVKDTQQVAPEGNTGEIIDITPDTDSEAPAGPDNTDRQAPPSAVTAAATPATDLGDIDQRLFTQISEAAQAALDRAFERAANRIRNEIKPNRGGKNAGARAERYPAAFATIEGLSGRDVGLALGGKVVRETLQLTDDDLIPESTFETFRQRVQRILARGQDETHQAAQQLLGTELSRSPEEESWVERAAGFLTAALTALALRRLFTPDPSPDPAETGEIPDTDVPAGDVFDTLTIAGGGEPATAPDQPRGLATGQQTEVWIQEAGAVKEGYVWRHGTPAVPFEPHQRLNGTRFENWTSEALATPGFASWLRTPYMFPGDHRGCTCSAVPVLDLPDE